MKKATFLSTLYAFHTNMNRDLDLLMKVEKAKRVVGTIQEKRSIFEAFVLSICADWECLVENLLIDCLNKDTSRYVEYTGFSIPKHITRDTCKAILIGINYLDFKSTDQLKKLGKFILIQTCNPFPSIPASDCRRIDELFTIRNYLAHRSFAARRSLQHLYKSKYHLGHFIEPGTFLLARDKERKMPRLGVYINNFKEAANTMGRFLGMSWLSDNETREKQDNSS